jgi:membrane associated rhomboid family serine protease
MAIIALLVLIGAAVYFTTPEERTRLGRAVVALLRRLTESTNRLRAQYAQPAEPEDTPRAWPIVAIGLTAGTFALSAWVALAAGSLADPEKLVSWGANFGPRTTNGEWWRLVAAMFIHGSVLGLIVNVAALLQVSIVLERVVGRPTLIAVYLSAGVFAGLVSLSVRPVDLTTGASGAVLGLYGLLLTSWMWGLIHQSPAVRLPMIAKIAPAATVFLVYHSFGGELARPAQTAALVTGFAGGLVLAHGFHVRKPSVRRLAVVVGATAVLAVLSAAPMRGLTDVRPLVARILSVEKATAAAYDVQVAKFREGRASVEVLCSLIERKILPELQAAAAPLNAIRGVPAPHEPLTAAARDFVGLRLESWRLRVRGLRKSSMPTLRQADGVERKSLELFEKVIAGQPAAS